MNPLGRRWTETFGGTMRLHLVDVLICPSRQSVAPAVRAWHAKVLRPRVGRTSISQSYRLRFSTRRSLPDIGLRWSRGTGLSAYCSAQPRDAKASSHLHHPLTSFCQSHQF